MGEEFIHVDRAQRLSPDDVLGYIEFEKWTGQATTPKGTHRTATIRNPAGADVIGVSEPDVEVLEGLYPDGFSSHGVSYAVGVPDGDKQGNSPHEIFAEHVRRARSPHRPSRFESYFGSPDKKNADNFVDYVSDDDEEKDASAGADYWIVECEEYHILDMTLLTHPLHFPRAERRLRKYWSGEGSDDPIWEVLMEPPIRVQEKL